MTKAGIRFRQKDNCFTWIEDLAEAQRLLDTQLTTDWPALLQRWAEQSNPVENTFLQKPVQYYWTTQESEYASDILFHEREDLSRLYPQWVGYAYSILKRGSLLR